MSGFGCGEVDFELVMRKTWQPQYHTQNDKISFEAVPTPAVPCAGSGPHIRKK